MWRTTPVTLMVEHIAILQKDGPCITGCLRMTPIPLTFSDTAKSRASGNSWPYDWPYARPYAGEKTGAGLVNGGIGHRALAESYTAAQQHG